MIPKLSISDVLSRLKSVLGATTDVALAEKMGVPLRRLQTWKARNTIPAEDIIAVCEQYDLDQNHIWSGRPASEIGPDRQTASTHTVPPLNEIDRITSNQIVDTIHMSTQWLRHVLNVSPENIVLIRVAGNNMSPWAVDGDLVIVDFSEKTIINDAPYVIKIGEILVIKRLVRQPDNTIIAKSDSPYCEDEIFSADTPPQVIGRILRRITR